MWETFPANPSETNLSDCDRFHQIPDGYNVEGMPHVLGLCGPQFDGADRDEFLVIILIRGTFDSYSPIAFINSSVYELHGCCYIVRCVIDMILCD